MALETRFYWHVSILVKKKKKDSFRARGIPIMHLLLHAASAYNFFDQQCLVGICFMNFGWFLSVKYIGWIFNNINFGIYWCNIGASLIFFLSLILIQWRSIDIFCNNFIIITYINEPLICFCIIWGFFRGRG